MGGFRLRARHEFMVTWLGCRGVGRGERVREGREVMRSNLGSGRCDAAGCHGVWEI